jgi:hypothetical protein
MGKRCARTVYSCAVQANVKVLPRCEWIDAANAAVEPSSDVGSRRVTPPSCAHNANVSLA